LSQFLPPTEAKTNISEQVALDAGASKETQVKAHAFDSLTSTILGIAANPDLGLAGRVLSGISDAFSILDFIELGREIFPGHPVC